jgi:ankyrin repeat and BTB/POZ domain-containing protein 1
MTEILRKDQLERSLHDEKKLIEEGVLKEDNPLDLSESFRIFCEACRRGDLKVCQEQIQEGVNINAKDQYDYTPLILVSTIHEVAIHSLTVNSRLVYAATMRQSNCFSSLAHYVSGTLFRAKDVSTTR